jgi:hypothetical protein
MVAITNDEAITITMMQRSAFPVERGKGLTRLALNDGWRFRRTALPTRLQKTKRRRSGKNEQIVELDTREVKDETPEDRSRATRYNASMPETKPFRLTQSVKAAG